VLSQNWLEMSFPKNGTFILRDFAIFTLENKANGVEKAERGIWAHVRSWVMKALEKYNTSQD
jgi:hypothetical protein